MGEDKINMFDIITVLSTNLFRTFIIKRFMTIFFLEEVENKRKERILYSLFFLITMAVYLIFDFPPTNIAVNLIMIYAITQAYEGEQKKKLLVSILIYGINMACDIFAVYSFSDYVFGKEHNEIAAYITVFMFSICEFLAERVVIKKREVQFAPLYWSILILIPVTSIMILFVLIVSNLNSQMILISVSAGILLINMLIFYLYNALLETYLKLEDNILFERQIASYANQLDVLMQSEEKISALRHDLKHHLNELMILTTDERKTKAEIADYIQSMQMFMENKNEYACSGNKEVDSILNYMLNKAEKVLKRVDYKINIPKEIGINQFDFNVIFWNLLENAISAAADSKEKWLSVLIQYEKGLLFINIRNSFENTIMKQGTKYLSTKKEGGRHGIGLQNVKRVVKRYRGNIEITEKDKVFDVKIMMYMLLMK